MPKYKFKLTRMYQKQVIATVTAESMQEAAGKIYRGQAPDLIKKMDKAEPELVDEKLIFYKEE